MCTHLWHALDSLIFLLMIGRPPRSKLLPYTTIFGSVTGSATTGNTDTLQLDGTATGNSVSGVIGNGSGGGKSEEPTAVTESRQYLVCHTNTGNTTTRAGSKTMSSITCL